MKWYLAAFFAGAAIAIGQAGEPLSLVARIPLEKVEGRIDHFSPDVQGERIFVSALGNDTVEVLDVTAGRRVKTIRDVAEPQGVYYEDSTNRLFAACGGDGAVKVFYAGTFQLLSAVKLSSDADNVRYDPNGHRVIVGYGQGALALLDARGKKIGEIPLDGHPESFQVEKSGRRVFVNVPDHNEIEVANLNKSSVVARWSVTSALHNFPMALDEAHHRLLIGCRRPARMLAMDTDTGKQTASVEIVGDTDDLFYDSARGRVYVIGGQGFLDVFEQKDPDRYKHLARYRTALGTRTGLFVPEWGKLFVAEPRRGGASAEVLVYQTK